MHIQKKDRISSVFILFSHICSEKEKEKRIIREDETGDCPLAKSIYR